MTRFSSLLLVFLLSACHAGEAPQSTTQPHSKPSSKSTLYLTVEASSSASFMALATYKKFYTRFPELLVVKSDDCLNLPPNQLLFVSAVRELSNKPTPSSAHTIKACTVKPDSLLDYGVSLLDSSLTLINPQAINWTFQDLKTTIYTLSQGAALLLKNIYATDPLSETEGHASALYYAAQKSAPIKLVLPYCLNLSAITQVHHYVLFQCVTGVANEHDIHTSYIFDTQKRSIIHEQAYCRTPQLDTPQLNTSQLNKEMRFRCQEESVNADGELDTAQILSVSID